MIYPGTGTISSGGVSGPTAFTGNAPIPEHNVTSWSYPVGWYVVGAPANRAIAPPWN